MSSKICDTAAQLSTTNKRQKKNDKKKIAFSFLYLLDGIELSSILHRIGADLGYRIAEKNITGAVDTTLQVAARDIVYFKVSMKTQRGKGGISRRSCRTG